MISQNTLLRLMAVLRLIPVGPNMIDAATIQKRLEYEGFQVGGKAGKRKIERDLRKIEESFGIICDDSYKPFLWYWDPDRHRERRRMANIPVMEPMEALTMALAEDFLKPLMPQSDLKRLKKYFSEANHSLKALGESDLAKWRQKVRVQPGWQVLKPAKSKEEVQKKIYQAVMRQKTVQADYKSRNSDTYKSHEIRPLGLVYRDRLVYLICSMDSHQEDISYLPLHRFNKVELTDKSFRKPKGYNLDKFLLEGNLGFLNSDKKLKVEIAFKKEDVYHLNETPISSDQVIISMKDGRMKLKATVADTEQLKWWIMGFGSSAEVLKPVSLRKEFKETYSFLAKKYS